MSDTMTLADLREQILVTPFVELEPHLKRGAVVLIDETLDLAEVGLALVEDRKEWIAELIADLRITKASPVEVEKWRREKQFFKIVIVQPFVVAQYFAALAPVAN